MLKVMIGKLYRNLMKKSESRKARGYIGGMTASFVILILINLNMILSRISNEFIITSTCDRSEAEEHEMYIASIERLIIPAA